MTAEIAWLSKPNLSVKEAPDRLAERLGPAIQGRPAAGLDGKPWTMVLDHG